MSRRRTLGIAGRGVGGLATAALIGCSAGKGEPKPAKSGGASIATPGTAAEKPKPGGTMKFAARVDPDFLDPNKRGAGGSPNGQYVSMVYSTLFDFDLGDGAAATGKISPDLAQKWEQPDPLTLVVHLDPAAKFDDRPPLNGRALNAEDVVQTWKHFDDGSFRRSTLSNAANPDAPVETIEAVDASTARLKLKFPDATLFPVLARNFPVQPAEGIAGKFDLNQEMRGTGPFLLEKYQKAVGISFKKNPKWSRGGGERPYVDAVNVTIIPDQAQMEVQFRSKNLHLGAVSFVNLVSFAKELKGTEVVVLGPETNSPAWGLSYLPGQPWEDVRVRRAVSMAIDRDAYADVVFNPKQFEQVGVKLNVRWNAPISAGYGAMWIDPKSDRFGPAAQYLKHNVPEAKKLLEAAGYSAQKPLEFDVVYPGTTYGTDWPTRAETLQSMVRDAGVKANIVSIDYTEYIAKYFRAKARFEGKTIKPAVQFPPGGTQVDGLTYYFQFLGGTGAFSLVGTAFPALDEMMRKQRAVTNFDERVAGLHEMQRYSTEQMIVVPVGPATELVDLVWKELRGPHRYRAYQGNSVAADALPYYWYQSAL